MAMFGLMSLGTLTLEAFVFLGKRNVPAASPPVSLLIGL